MSEVPFWLTDEGIRIRLADLAHLVVTRMWNNVIQTNAYDFGVISFRYRTADDDRVCVFCAPRNNKDYKPYQFMPSLPIHQNCRCYFDANIGKPQPGVV